MPKNARTNKKYIVQMNRKKRFLIIMNIWPQSYNKNFIKSSKQNKITYIINILLDS